MKRSIIATLLAIAAVASTSAFADGGLAGDISVAPATTPTSVPRAQVEAQLKQFRQSGVNPWATDYDQLAGFHGTRSRAEVTAEFLRSRDQVAAMTGEDSGSSYLTAHSGSEPAPVLAGQPVNPQ